MSRRVKTGALLLAVLINAGTAWANRAPRPEPPNPPNPPGAVEHLYPLRVQIDPQSAVATLQIPSGVGQPAENINGDAGFRRRTMIAGTAMSLALASLVFLRRTSRTRQVAVCLIVAATLAAGAIEIARADIALPPDAARLRQPPAGPLVSVQATGGVEGVTLILSKDLLDQLTKSAIERPAPPPVANQPGRPRK